MISVGGADASAPAAPAAAGTGTTSAGGTTGGATTGGATTGAATTSGATTGGSTGKPAATTAVGPNGKAQADTQGLSQFESGLEFEPRSPNYKVAFSLEDATTMDALVTALGRRLRFSVVAPAGMVRSTVTAGKAPIATLVREEPWWAPLLRLASGMNERTPLQEK